MAGRPIGQFLVALLAVLSVFAAEAVGREGLMIGGGLVRAEQAGGLDGSHAYCVEPTCTTPPAVYPGKLDAGNGVAFLIGYGFGPHWGVEFLSQHSGHTAHNVAVQGTMTANVSINSLNLRATAPVGDATQLVGRFGFGVSSVRYESATYTGSSALEEAEFTGRGATFGVGFEWGFDPLALEIGLLHHVGKLVNLDAGGISGGLPEPKLLMTTAAVNLLFYF